MKTYKKLLFAFAFILTIPAIYAQQGEFYQFSLEKETKVRGSKIYFEGFTNKGTENQIDVHTLAIPNIAMFYYTYSGVKAKKIQNHISWTTHPLFEEVTNPTEADVIIGGSYLIKTKEEVEENLYYEKANSVGGAIPYYETRQINSAGINVLIKYTYKDKTTDYDTINVQFDSERKPGTKLLSINDLLAKCESSLKSGFYNTFKFYSHEPVWYKFLSVKVKDKTLKEELSSAKDLFESGEIKKLGNLYQRIYSAEPDNKEAAFNTAMCYELIGNYAKAQEYYAIMPDFHAKVRMKQNQILFDYLNEIGANVVVEDF